MPPAVVAALVTFVAFLIGLTLPDLDLRLWLGHRSALTHSIVPACALLARRRWHPAACGVGAGTGLHLAADTFPNRMIGYATVKLPFLGALSAAQSYAWLAINALAGLALAAWLARRLHAPLIAGLLMLAALAAGICGAPMADGRCWRWRPARSGWRGGCAARSTTIRHCQRSEATRRVLIRRWIASLAMTG